MLRRSALPPFQHHAVHTLAEHRHVKIHQHSSTQPAQAQDGLELLLLQRCDLLLGTDHEQKPALHDEIEPRGVFYLMLTVGEIEWNCAAEVHFQLTQLDGHALLVSLAKQSWTEAAMHIQAGTNHEVGKVGVVHQAGN